MKLVQNLKTKKISQLNQKPPNYETNPNFTHPYEFFHHYRKPNNPTLKHTKLVHASMLKMGVCHSDVFVGNSLMGWYCNSREMVSAATLFDKIPNPNGITWNILISGFNTNLLFGESWSVFCKMRLMGFNPNEFTYGSVVAACIGLQSVICGHQVKRMISIRRLSYRTRRLSELARFSLVADHHCYTFFKTSRCNLHYYFSTRPSFELNGLPLSNQCDKPELPKRFYRLVRSFSTMTGTLLVQARDPGKLCIELENAVEGHQLDEAWRLYEQLMQMEGFPRKSIVNLLLTSFAESLNREHVKTAFGLVEKAFEESKHTQLESGTLLFLSYSLAKCILPVHASTVLRKLVKMEQFPPVTAWSAILAHISQTPSGSYLAAELVLEIGYLFKDNRIDPRKKSNAPLIAMKPNTVAFNTALAGCLLFGTTKKAEQLLDMMPRVAVKADANSLIIMAHIYERNGRIDELKKLKRHIEEAHNLNDAQFRQFYSCLLSCHLKLGDLEAVSTMVIEMLRKAKIARNSLASATLKFETVAKAKEQSPGKLTVQSSSYRHLDDSEKLRSLTGSYDTFEEFSKDSNFLKLDLEAKEILNRLLEKLETQVDLITSEHGILQPAEIIYVKLVKAFLEAGNTKDLAAFLINAEKEDSPSSVDSSALVHVINSCISLGWLDQAHDLLDEMRSAGIRTSSSVYGSLLKAYCKANREGEVAALLRDVRKAGIQLDSSCYEALIQSRVLQKDTTMALHLFKEMKVAKIPRTGHSEFDILVKGCAEGGEAGLMAKLLHEIEEGQKIDSGVHDWNNVIHFFCRKRLMGDAEKALKKMMSLGYASNAQTFHSMVTGYAAIGGKYIQVTELWGEMKVLFLNSGMKFDQELLDSVLYTFVRGGFFSRANEVIEMMEKGNMFIDKYKYRMLFLKYHKTLHKNKAPKIQTEAQFKKREAALSFKKWVGLF